MKFRASAFVLAFVLAIVLAVVSIGLRGSRAQERIAIFDAHLHYNQEPRPFYSLDEVRETFRTLRPRGGPKPLRAFSFLEVEGEEAVEEKVDLVGMASDRERK